MYQEYVNNNDNNHTNYSKNNQTKIKHQKKSTSAMIPSSSPNVIRFTKVLTKYSTEYNNYIFIQELCQKLSMDKKDLFGYLLFIKNMHDENYIYNLFENYEISKLDSNRIYRYLDKYMKEDAADIAEKEIEMENENEFDTGCEDCE